MIQMSMEKLDMRGTSTSSIDFSKVQDTRLTRCFAHCKSENRPALIPFITAGDPDLATSQKILEALPGVGSDIIELGMAFSDPLAEGAPIQMASARALASGQTLSKTLEMVERFRQKDDKTPLILMGYYNPIYVYGIDPFLDKASSCGVDGLLLVDVPREMDYEIVPLAVQKGVHFIHLAAPTTDRQRLRFILEHVSGFLYMVALAGVTGAELTQIERAEAQLAQIKAQTDIPVAVGFGIKTPEHVTQIGQKAEAIVVGSVLVETIRHSLGSDGKATAGTVEAVCRFVETLSCAAREARS